MRDEQSSSKDFAPLTRTFTPVLEFFIELLRKLRSVNISSLVEIRGIGRI